MMLLMYCWCDPDEMVIMLLLMMTADDGPTCRLVSLHALLRYLREIRVRKSSNSRVGC
jgi:hypothetical protein